MNHSTDYHDHMFDPGPNKPSRQPGIGVRLWCWLRNLRHWKTARAIRDLEKAFATDDGFVLTWKCHIAMTLIDRCDIPHDKANESADELMRALFGKKPVI